MGAKREQNASTKKNINKVRTCLKNRIRKKKISKAG